MMRLYDTGRGEVVDFEPGPTVTMYVCGLTPYDATHLGHATTHVTYDVPQRRRREPRNTTPAASDRRRRGRAGGGGVDGGGVIGGGAEGGAEGGVVAVERLGTGVHGEAGG